MNKKTNLRIVLRGFMVWVSCSFRWTGSSKVAARRPQWPLATSRRQRLGHAPPPPRPFGLDWRHRCGRCRPLAGENFEVPIHRNGRLHRLRKRRLEQAKNRIVFPKRFGAGNLTPPWREETVLWAEQVGGDEEQAEDDDDGWTGSDS
jgi:hypothetical protein